MNFEIIYHEAVVKEDISRLPKNVQQRIKRAIEKRLRVYPEQFSKPLRRSLKGYKKLRVGDFRIIFRIEKNIIKIFIIQHRSIAYKKSTARLF